MPIVNYIREHRRFIQYASDEKLTANERLLWYALMEIMNQRADGRDWPDDFIRISNDRVLTLCPMGFDTMAKARNGLKQRGRIEFMPGDKNKTNPAYKMIYFCPGDYPEDSDKDRFYPEISDNTQDNTRGNTGGNRQGNTQGNMKGNTGDIIPNQNQKYIYTKRVLDEEEEDDVDHPDDERARESYFISAAKQSYLRCFGRIPTPVECGRLAGANIRLGFSVEMVSLALEIAAGKGAKNPVDYALSILGDWWENYVMQVHQADEYRFLQDAMSGRNEYGTGDSIADRQKLDEARERWIAENEDAGIRQRYHALKAAEG